MYYYDNGRYLYIWGKCVLGCAYLPLIKRPHGGAQSTQNLQRYEQQSKRTLGEIKNTRKLYKNKQQYFARLLFLHLWLFSWNADTAFQLLIMIRTKFFIILHLFFSHIPHLRNSVQTSKRSARSGIDGYYFSYS